jgi:hypothetical protein
MPDGCQPIWSGQFLAKTDLSVNESKMKCLFKNVAPGWVQTSVSVFSPDKKIMVFTIQNQTIIRDVSNSEVKVWDVRSEKILWSSDSSLLAIYDSNGKIYTILPTPGALQEIHSLSEMGDLEEWMWLPDNQHILLIVMDEDGYRQIGVLSIMEKTFIPLTIDKSLLSEYDPVSFSFRP